MYTKKQIEAFIAKQDNVKLQKWWGTNRDLTTDVLERFQDYCKSKKYQMLYKNKESGMYFASSKEYATNAAFYADYDCNSVLAIRFLNDELPNL